MLAEELNLVPNTGIAADAHSSFPNVSTLLTSAVNLVFVLAVILFFFMLVIGGVRWITSGGDKAQTESAKGQITAAVIGLVIVLATYAIINLVDTFFGIDILNGLNIGPVT